MFALLRFVKDPWMVLAISLPLTLSVIILRSIAPFVFPNYFVFIVIGIMIFFLASSVDFEVFEAFAPHLYLFGVLLLIVTLIIGQVTRGTIRWIPVGSFTIQPAEIVRPFLVLYAARFLSSKELDRARVLKAAVVLLLPLVLIVVQPSLGITVLTLIGFSGVGLSLPFNKKYLLLLAVGFVSILPVFWQVMQPYQKDRITSFLSAEADSSGAGYNSIQSTISVGSGQLTGRGLGEGVQTQLLFLPERHTDFVFAAISEELGLMGAVLTIVVLFTVLFRVLKALDMPRTFTARAFISGVFLTIFAQVMVHIGMNMGLFPITGIPLPFLSAGGSSLLGMMLMLGMVVSAKKT